MAQITCPACSQLNTYDAPTCLKCSGSLDAARLSILIADTSTRIDAALGSGAPSFNSYNGFGTTLLNYRPLPDGLWRATRWAVAAHLPLLPLGDYVIRPGLEVGNPIQRKKSFRVVRREPMQARSIAKVYAVVAIIVGTAITLLAGGGKWIERQVGGPMSVGIVLVIVIGLAILLGRLHNEDVAYKGR